MQEAHAFKSTWGTITKDFMENTQARAQCVTHTCLPVCGFNSSDLWHASNFLHRKPRHKLVSNDLVPVPVLKPIIIMFLLSLHGCFHCT